MDINLKRKKMIDFGKTKLFKEVMIMNVNYDSIADWKNLNELSDYVAHLQLHMSLQSRNLLPKINQNQDHRSNLLYETQAMTEKFTSRELT